MLFKKGVKIVDTILLLTAFWMPGDWTHGPVVDTFIIQHNLLTPAVLTSLHQKLELGVQPWSLSISGNSTYNYWSKRVFVEGFFHRKIN